jgi:membrane protein DedA with SNARE-associated domain
MIETIIKQLALIIIFFLNRLGYWGVLILMALESCNIPIPSEIILPYAGFLVSQGRLDFHLVAFVGALACLLGSMFSYWLGQKLGRPFLWKYGKWILISHKDINHADRFITRFGNATYFFSRLLPVVRTFISLVAGISRGNFKKFCFYTFLGSWIWSYLLVFAGVKLGEHWDNLRPLWDRFQVAIVTLILVGIIWHIFRAFKNSREKISL